MSLLNSISNGFFKDVRPGDIVDVVIVISVIIFPVSLYDLLRSSHKKMLKDGSLRVGG